MKFFNLAFVSAFPGPNLQRKSSFGPNPLKASSLTNVVNLNVGGVKYSLFDEDIRKHPGSFFEKALEAKTGDAGDVNVERDGNLFKFVNAFMVNGQLPRDQKGGLTLDADVVAGVKSEAEFFGLPGLQKECDELDNCVQGNCSHELSSYIKIRKYLKHFKSRILKNPVEVVPRSSPLSNAVHKMWNAAYSQGRFHAFVRNALFKDTSPESVNVEQLVDTAKQLHPATAEGNEFEIGAFLLNEAVLKELANECDLDDLFGEKDIEVRPNKLQIHTVGGSYSTPAHNTTETDRVGTLVLILNNVYQGGEMDVRLDGQKAALRTGPYSYVVLQNDVDHSIRPVTGGARVSLLYDLYDKTGAKPPTPAAVVEAKGADSMYRPRKYNHMYRTDANQSRVYDYAPGNGYNWWSYRLDRDYYASQDFIDDTADKKMLTNEVAKSHPMRFRKGRHMYRRDPDWNGYSTDEYESFIYDYNTNRWDNEYHYETDECYYESPEFLEDMTKAKRLQSATTVVSETAAPTVSQRRARKKDQFMFRRDPDWRGYETDESESYIFDYDPNKPTEHEYELDESYYETSAYTEDKAEDERLTTAAAAAADGTTATDPAATAEVGKMEEQLRENNSGEVDDHDDESDDESDYSDYSTDCGYDTDTDNNYDTDSDYDGDDDEDNNYNDTDTWRDDDLNTPPLTRTTVSQEVRKGVSTALNSALLSADAVVVGLQHLYPDTDTITTVDSGILQGGDRALYDLLSEQFDVQVVTANIYKEYDYDTDSTNMRAGLFESSALVETGFINTAHSSTVTTTTVAASTTSDTTTITDTNITYPVATTATLPVIKLVLPPALTGEHTVGASEMEYHYRRGKDQAYLVTGLKVSKREMNGTGGSGGGSDGSASGIAE